MHVACDVHLLLKAVLRSVHSSNLGKPNQRLAILDGQSRHDHHDDNGTTHHGLSSTSKAHAQQKPRSRFRGEITFKRPKYLGRSLYKLSLTRQAFQLLRKGGSYREVLEAVFVVTSCFLASLTRRLFWVPLPGLLLTVQKVVILRETVWRQAVVASSLKRDHHSDCHTWTRNELMVVQLPD